MTNAPVGPAEETSAQMLLCYVPVVDASQLKRVSQFAIMSF
jgi:hypothetical protein